MNLLSQKLKEKFSLYLCQLCTTFDMLVQLIEEQHQLNAPIFVRSNFYIIYFKLKFYCVYFLTFIMIFFFQSCKKYVCDRLCWCFKGIIEILDASNPPPEEEYFEKENHFVYRLKKYTLNNSEPHFYRDFIIIYKIYV